MQCAASNVVGNSKKLGKDKECVNSMSGLVKYAS